VFGAILHVEFCHKFPLSPGCATAETFHAFLKLIFFPNAKTWNKFFFDLNHLHYDKALQHVSSVTESVRSSSQLAWELAEQFDYDYY